MDRRDWPQQIVGRRKIAQAIDVRKPHKGTDVGRDVTISAELDRSLWVKSYSPHLD